MGLVLKKENDLEQLSTSLEEFLFFLMFLKETKRFLNTPKPGWLEACLRDQSENEKLTEEFEEFKKKFRPGEELACHADC